MRDTELKNTDACDVALTRHGIIEASAGTGKTYMLVRLFARMLAEKTEKKEYVSLKEIVVVTFTEKATGEMRERIRQYLNDVIEPPSDKKPEIESDPLRRRVEADDALRSHLLTALRGFEEAQISTIHAFCKKMIGEYALDCGVPMDFTVERDIDLYTQALNQFLRFWSRQKALSVRLAQTAACQEGGAWRKRVLALAQKSDYCPADQYDSPECRHAAADKILQEAIAEYRSAMGQIDLDCIKACLGYIPTQKTNKDTKKKEYTHRPEDYPYPTEEIKKLRDFYNECKKQISHPPQTDEQAVACIDKLLAKIPKADASEKPFEALAREPNEKELAQVRNNQNVRTWKDFPKIREFAEPLSCAAVKRNIARIAVLNAIIAELRQKVGEMKRGKRVLSFDDLTRKFADAIKDNPSLLKKLQDRFRYALIDEFQDTDAKQWEIFRALFLNRGNDSVSGKIFLIGDPKQAIYGFRGGDIAAYYSARNEICTDEHGGRAYSLATNFRAMPEMTEACNRLFSRYWFRYFKGSGLPDSGGGKFFEPSDSPQDKKTIAEEMGIVLPREDNAPVVIVAHDCETKGKLFSNHAYYIAGEIARLVKQSGAIAGANPAQGARALRYSDCTVLVRSRLDAEAVMRAFRMPKFKIPFTQYKHNALWATPEAEALIAVMDALASADESAISRALASQFFDCPFEQLQDAGSARKTLQKWSDDLAAQRKWALLAAKLEKQYCSLARSSSDPASDSFDKKIDQRDWERKTANMRQLLLISLLADDAHLRTPKEMALFLRQQAEQASAARVDEDMQPLESEADRVKIMTMHVAKGLEFPVVFVHGGFGNFKSMQGYHNEYLEYYDDEGVKKYIPGKIYDADQEKPAEGYWQAENARLMYVAVTRAMLRVYLLSNTQPDDEKSDIPADEPDDESADNDTEAADASDNKNGIGMYSCLIEGLKETDPEAKSKDGKKLFKLVIAPPPGDMPHSADGSEYSGDSENFEPLTSAYPAEKLPVHRTISFSSLQKILKPQDGGQEEAQHGTNRLPCLPPSANSGDAVHKLLEKLDFDRAARALADVRAADSAWLDSIIGSVIEEFKLKAYSAWLRQKNIPESSEPDKAKHHIRAYLKNLIRGLLDAPVPRIGPSFKFSSLTPAVCLKEAYFLEKNPVAGYELLEKKPLAGYEQLGAMDDMMSGVIDLIFWHEGKIYIADWKTNRLENYEHEAMEKAMKKGEMEYNDYHLQAAIYAGAVKRFIMQRGLPQDSFGGVLYVFTRAFTDGIYGESDAPGSPDAGLYFMDRKMIDEKIQEQSGLAQ